MDVFKYSSSHARSRIDIVHPVFVPPSELHCLKSCTLAPGGLTTNFVKIISDYSFILPLILLLVCIYIPSQNIVNGKGIIVKIRDFLVRPRGVGAEYYAQSLVSGREVENSGKKLPYSSSDQNETFTNKRPYTRTYNIQHWYKYYRSSWI